MNIEEIRQKAIESGLVLNDTELELCRAVIAYNTGAVSTSMDIGLAWDKGAAYDNLQTDQRSILNQFMEWLWEGEPCSKCHGVGFLRTIPDDGWDEHCEHCDGTGRLYTQTFTPWQP